MVMVQLVSLDALLDRAAEDERGEQDDDHTVDTCSQRYIDAILSDVPDETGVGVDGLPIDDDLPALVAYERQRRRDLRAA
jgi:hypothetical protein